jgi:hypothetical protein
MTVLVIFPPLRVQIWTIQVCVTVLSYLYYEYWFEWFTRQTNSCEYYSTAGLRLYKQPTAKSNRSIMLNAVEYCVFPGVVNRDHKMRVLEEINRSESKHFLIMFRDAGCQFRALYSYVPENDEIVKLFGVGPKQVTDDMFEKFFKYVNFELD